MFTRDEIAEAFAAARGVASPTQLRTVMKRDGRDLLQEFRTLAPGPRPISLQRWNVKRIALALALAFGAVIVIANIGNLFVPTYDHKLGAPPNCGTGNTLVLMAQAVPSATSLPCLASLPAGWKLGDVRIERGKARFWLDSDRAGNRAVEATLLGEGRCSVTGSTEVPSDVVGMRRFERAEQLPPQLRATRTYLFPGGCVTYRFEFDSPETAPLLFDGDNALSFQNRSVLVDAVRSRNGLRLCGAGVNCPGGE